MRDWEGREAPENEAPETVIRVWNIKPHADETYDYAVIRGWQDALNYVRSVTEDFLEMDELPTREEPFRVEVWTSEMTLADYRELIERTT